jgi:uncharacterized protein DUF4429/putative oligomerization/nucleic acid binding protein
MSRMGDVLAGIHSTWEFDEDSVLIRFERGIRTPRLFHVLGRRRVPYEALGSVEVLPGRRGTVVLRAAPRPGADPLLDAADGRLKDGCDPYRLVLPSEEQPAAEGRAAQLRALLPIDAAEPAERHLVAAPAAPLHFKAYDGKASFDGATVSFHWFRTGASSAKWRVGDQEFPVGELEDVEWRPPGAGGHLRLRRRGVDHPEEADQDPAAVVFGLGYGLLHESLPFAASVLEAVRAAEPVPASAGCGRDACAPHRGGAQAVRSDPADIAERIRHLGELHESGLLTDEEFSGKKAQLLAEL